MKDSVYFLLRDASNSNPLCLEMDKYFAVRTHTTGFLSVYKKQRLHLEKSCPNIKHFFLNIFSSWKEVVLWVALLPLGYRARVTISAVVRMFSCIRVNFALVLWFPHTSQKHGGRQTGFTKLPHECVNVCVCARCAVMDQCPNQIFLPHTQCP